MRYKNRGWNLTNFKNIVEGISTCKSVQLQPRIANATTFWKTTLEFSIVSTCCKRPRLKAWSQWSLCSYTLLRECDEVLVTTWNYTYRSLLGRRLEGKGSFRSGARETRLARPTLFSRAPNPISLPIQTSATQATHIVTVRNSKCNCVWSFSSKALSFEKDVILYVENL